MPSLDDALKSVHDIILNRFGEGGATPSGIAVAFELGTPLPLSALQNPSVPPTPSPARARELMSTLCNFVPNLHDMFCDRGLRTVDGQYELLLRGAQPLNTGELDVFSTIKSEALTKFADVLQSVEGPQQFHPVGPTPVNWYDPNVNDIWSHFHIANESGPTGELVDRPRQDGPAGGRNPQPQLTGTQTFQTDVIDASNHQPVLVEFWASWVGPCRMMQPKLEDALRAAKNAIRWIRVDVDVDDVKSFVAVRGLP